MKNKIIENIHDNIISLKEISIVDDHDEIWSLNQLIAKYQILLNFLEKEIGVDIDKFSDVVEEIQDEANYFISKY